MSALGSAGFFSSINTSGRRSMNRMMFGRRVWCAPVMERVDGQPTEHCLFKLVFVHGQRASSST